MNEFTAILRVFEQIAQHIGADGTIGLLGGYLLGAMPFGLILCYIFGYGDIRKIGSGNIGATNVLRTGNKFLALITLILDSSKGAIAVLIGWQFGPAFAFGAALGSVLGHNFPIWLKFKGGKGVATTLGVLLALSWPVGLAACVTWFVVALIFRMSSLAALIALAAAPFYTLYIGEPKQVYLVALLTVIAWLRHHQNIRRILKGEEPKIGQKKKA
ncbi:MAG: acyl-phosphate glycerol 3-phosphate acyltransferase [Micavibrio sp.]|nr:acyl-phosphate glycerol 3-phosphate acyltransferase [Micavibrio sp.]|tara:strand:- start:818 stop:1462 length:645 start_codon:yes stop_codon:yes gene_type:complete